MVEFTLVFLLLFTLITLIAQGGLFFAGWLAVTNAAREGARFGAPCLNRTVEPCAVPTIEAVALEHVAGFIDPTPGPVVAVQVDPGGGYVTVTVTGTVSSVGPLPLDLPVYGVSTMRLEMSPQ
jgi:Flp pilus assembly protein TadG